MADSSFTPFLNFCEVFTICCALLCCMYLPTWHKLLTRKVLEEMLNVKLSPLKGRIQDLTDKMAEFREFIDEATETTKLRINVCIGRNRFSVISALKARFLNDSIRHLALRKTTSRSV